MTNEYDEGGWSGWPKMIGGDPPRPDGIWTKTELNEPHDLSTNCQDGYQRTGSTYFVFEVFKFFHKVGLYPPRWALDAIVEKIECHLGNPDPELLSLQFGVTSLGSGSQSPLESYKWHTERLEALTEMMILLRGFDISLNKAAKAIIEKRNITITPKRLVNEFRDNFGDTRLHMYKNLDFGPFLDEESRDAFISQFPNSALRFVKDRRPRVKLGGIEEK